MENKPICEIDKYGTKCWYLNGYRHRLDGPAIEYLDGVKYWYLNGVQHREDGPAVELSNGTKKWFINGKLHKLDGPAIIWNDGSYLWYINSYNVTNKIHQWAKENDIDLNNLTDVDKLLIKLTWTDYRKT